MKSHIIQAIQERRLIRLNYNGRAFTVKPYVLGLTKDHVDALLCWQIAPPMRDPGYWRMLEISQISNLRLVDANKEPPQENPSFPLTDFVEVYATLAE